MKSQNFAWARAAGALALLGATLGVAMDWAHATSGTTRYAAPLSIGVAWWTFPLFALAAVALGLGPVVAERALGRVDPAPSIGRASAGMALFVVAYLLSCVLRGAVGAAVLFAIAVGIWLVVDRRPLGAAMALAAGVLGPLAESAQIAAGLFSHSDVAFAGVPAWLPCLYLSASLATSGLARTLVAHGEPGRSGAGQKPQHSSAVVPGMQ